MSFLSPGWALTDNIIKTCDVVPLGQWWGEASLSGYVKVCRTSFSTVSVGGVGAISGLHKNVKVQENTTKTGFGNMTVTITRES